MKEDHRGSVEAEVLGRGFHVSWVWCLTAHSAQYLPDVEEQGYCVRGKWKTDYVALPVGEASGQTCEDWGSRLCLDHKRLNLSVPLVAKPENVWWKIGIWREKKKKKMFVFWYLSCIVHKIGGNKEEESTMFCPKNRHTRYKNTFISGTFSYLNTLRLACCIIVQSV